MDTAAGGSTCNAGLLLISKSGSLNFRKKYFLPLKKSNYFSLYDKLYSLRDDSNAETAGSKKFKFKFNRKRYDEDEEDSRRKRKKRSWWSDKPSFMDDEDEKPSGILEEFIDSIWILQVFKSYGWALPPILISWLVASGPKAFLMTLAIPVGQSVITFMFTKLWEMTQGTNPKRKASKKRKPFVVSSSDFEAEEQEERHEKTMKGNSGFRSWVDNNDGSVDKGSQEAPYFGGWDELDKMEFMHHQPARRESKSQRRPSTNEKLGNRQSKSGVPLLLRLLISVFPFLGSWTKLLE